VTRLKVIGAGHASGAKTIAAHGPMRLRITTRGLVAMGLFLGFSLMASWVAQAQDVQLQTDRGPHYIGEPITVQIVASQFDENSTPEVDVPEIVGGRLRYAGVSDSSSTSISLINGKLTRSKEVRFIYRYELVVDRDGVFNIPAFRVRQGTTSRTTRPERIRVSSAARTGLVSLELNLPEGPIFVGQKVPIEVVLRVDREAQRDLISLTSSVPLFENKDVRFLDEPVPGADAQLELETSLGTIALPAIAKEIRIGGRAVLEVRAKRTMIALSTGEIRASAPRAMMSRGRGFRKGLFNQRQATSSERLMAEGDPVRLEVIEVPRAGRPPSFAGAVGQGFTLEVSADRSVVQLGEPITLQFRLQGEGDLTTAGLPPFDAAGLFDPKQFRLPEEAPAGLVDESGKHFEASLRVLDAGVREIPAVAYSWFDAGTRTYQTTHSRPIALLVGAAQIIGADDVARRSGDASLGASLDASSDASSGALFQGSSVAARGAREGDSEPSVRPERSTSMAVSGANLAIEDDVEILLGEEGAAPTSQYWPVAFYALGFALLAFSVWQLRVQARDPKDTARSEAFSAAAKGILTARSANAREGASILGRVLRELVAALPEEADPEIDGLIAECDALRFSPDASGSVAPASLMDRAATALAVRERAGTKGADQ
jgi:hypothetical protein